ncbi:uncharacterized protein LOC123501493, partial [Portunus trituberculatus]
RESGQAGQSKHVKKEGDGAERVKKRLRLDSGGDAESGAKVTDDSSVTHGPAPPHKKIKEEIKEEVKEEVKEEEAPVEEQVIDPNRGERATPTRPAAPKTKPSPAPARPKTPSKGAPPCDVLESIMAGMTQPGMHK